MQQATLVDRHVLGVDVEGFRSRNTSQQLTVQRCLATILDGAAAAAGLDRDRWTTQETGDGELAVLPPDLHLPLLTGRFVAELNDHLVRHNETHTRSTHIRLRVAVHCGSLVPQGRVFAGPALPELSRLLDAEVLRSALRTASSVTDADLALLVSDEVYRKVIEADVGGLRPRHFRCVEVRVKDFAAPAWLHVPGCDMRRFGGGAATGDSGPLPEPPEDPPDGTSAGVPEDPPKRPSPPTSGPHIRVDRSSGPVNTIVGDLTGGVNNIGNIGPRDATS